MNQIKPVSSLMSTHLVTVSPTDNLLTVKEIFESHSFHHLPVVELKKPVGIISRSKFFGYLMGLKHHVDQSHLDDVLLKTLTAEEIMTKKLAKVEPIDTVAVAVEVFRTNLVHSLLVVDKDELVGILTTHDIISLVSKEKINDLDYKN